jgi:hypothetical protein
MTEFTHDGGAWEHHPDVYETAAPDHELGTGWETGYTGSQDAVASSEIGNPAEYQGDWFYQQHNGYCVPSSVTQVIEAQTGTHLDSYSVVEQEAAKLGLPATDLTLPQAEELLQGFGVSSHVVTGGDAQTAVNDLAGYLEQGRSVVLAVNASPIWYGAADTSDNPDGQADHALVVSAIDSQTGVVTLSDPGSPSGNEEQVSLSTFLQAWSASDYGMLVTDHAAGTADMTGTAGTTGTTGTTDTTGTTADSGASPANMFGPSHPLASPDPLLPAEHTLGPLIGPEVGHAVVDHAGDVWHAGEALVSAGGRVIEAGFVVLPIALAGTWLYGAAAKRFGHA